MIGAGGVAAISSSTELLRCAEEGVMSPDQYKGMGLRGGAVRLSNSVALADMPRVGAALYTYGTSVQREKDKTKASSSSGDGSSGGGGESGGESGDVGANLMAVERLGSMRGGLAAALASTSGMCAGYVCRACVQ